MNPNPESAAHDRAWTDRVAASWDHFWFHPADPIVLGLLRICCGLVALYVHLNYTRHLQEYFGENAWIGLQTINVVRTETPVLANPWGWDEPSLAALPDDRQAQKQILDYYNKYGVDPRQTVAMGHSAWSIWFHLTDPWWMEVVHLAVLVILGLFTLGICTRITAALAWLAAVSYIQRSPAVTYGMDTLMIATLFYLMIGPSGAALSLDRLLARYRARRRARALGRPLLAQAAPPLASANFTLRLVQIHLCIIYLFSGLSKMQGGMWWNGTAAWVAMANAEIAPLQYRFVVDALRYLTQHRLLWEIVMTGGTLTTLVIEIGFPFLIWNRSMRWPMLAGALFLHMSIGLCMGLLTFAAAILTMAIAFIPPEAVHGTLRKLRQSLPFARRAADPAAGAEKAATNLEPQTHEAKVAIALAEEKHTDSMTNGQIPPHVPAAPGGGRILPEETRPRAIIKNGNERI